MSILKFLCVILLGIGILALGLASAPVVIAVFVLGMLWLGKKALIYKLIFWDDFNLNDIDDSVNYGFIGRFERISRKIDKDWIGSERNPDDYKKAMSEIGDEINLAIIAKSKILWKIAAFCFGATETFLFLFIFILTSYPGDGTSILCLCISFLFGLKATYPYQSALTLYISYLIEAKANVTQQHIVLYIEEKMLKAEIYK